MSDLIDRLVESDTAVEEQREVYIANQILAAINDPNAHNQIDATLELVRELAHDLIQMHVPSEAPEGGPGSALGRGDSWENPGHDLGR